MRDVAHKPPQRASAARRAGNTEEAAQQREQAPAHGIERIARARPSGGAPLPPSVRVPMERAYGARFDDVRVHVGDEARALGARAYTQGTDIHFQPGEYDPKSEGGLGIIGHELAHVVQQRAGRVAVPQGAGAPINADEHLEREADAMAARALRGEAASVSGAASPASGVVADAASAPVQRWPWSKKKKLNDKDLDGSLKSLGGGSINKVYRGLYSRLGGSKKKKEKTTGFFKPSGPSTAAVAYDMGIMDQKSDPRLPQRAVASARADKMVGLDILADEKLAEHKIPDERTGAPQLVPGSVSAAVGGRPLQEMQYDLPSRDPYAEEDSEHKKVDGKMMEHSGTKLPDIDYRQGSVQKGLIDLQLMDALTGQADHHSGNIFVDQGSGSVKGIDNDLAWGKEQSSVQELFANRNSKLAGLPPMVDKSTAEKFRKMDDKQLRKMLSEMGLDDSADAAIGRLHEIHSHLDTLEADGKIVGQEGGKYQGWDDTTYKDLVDEPLAELKDHRGTFTKERSYLQREVLRADQSRDVLTSWAPKVDGKHVYPARLSSPAFVEGTAAEKRYEHLKKMGPRKERIGAARAEVMRERDRERDRENRATNEIAARLDPRALRSGELARERRRAPPASTPGAQEAAAPEPSPLEAAPVSASPAAEAPPPAPEPVAAPAPTSQRARRPSLDLLKPGNLEARKKALERFGIQ